MEMEQVTHTVGQVGSYIQLKERKCNEPMTKQNCVFFPDML